MFFITHWSLLFSALISSWLINMCAVPQNGDTSSEQIIPFPDVSGEKQDIACTSCLCEWIWLSQTVERSEYCLRCLKVWLHKQGQTLPVFCCAALTLSASTCTGLLTLCLIITLLEFYVYLRPPQRYKKLCNGKKKIESAVCESIDPPFLWVPISFRSILMIASQIFWAIVQ